jgi:hypothetical protein
MKNTLWLGAGCALLAVTTLPAHAQSSGNFAAAVTTTQCTVNRATGALLGGTTEANENGGTILQTTIQTPNSSQTTLVITPSLVTGLYTNTLVTETAPESSRGAAVVVKVLLDGKPVLPATAQTPGVIYDERFQQLSTNVFSHIEECRDDNEATGDEQCNIDLALSTLSAHAFNFIAPNVGGGNHSLKVEWEFQCYGNDGEEVPCTTAYTANTAGACAGPGTVTVQQVKAFSQSGGIKVQ